MKSIFILLCIAMSAHAQLKDINVNIDSRYDRIENEDGTLAQNRLQDRVRIGFVFDAKGLFEIVGLAATGPSYGNDWNNAYQFDGKPADKQKLYFRKLYLQRMFGDKTQVQLGALGGIDSIGASGLGSSGWVDGVNINVNDEGQKFKVKLGSLSDPSNPDLFTRDRELNFAEVEVSKTFFDDLTLQAGYEHFQDDFLKGKATYDVTIVGKKVLKLVVKVLYDIQEDAYNYDIGASWDILNTFMEGHENNLKLDVYFSHLDSGLNFRNSLYSAYFQDGNKLVFQLSGKIDQKGRYNWFVRDAIGVNGKNRFDVGVSIKLGIKNKKVKKF